MFDLEEKLSPEEFKKRFKAALKELTQLEAGALLLIEEGLDVEDKDLALCLKAIRAKHPNFLTITKPQSNEDRAFYFGAIASEAGLKAAKKAVKL